MNYNDPNQQQYMMQQQSYGSQNQYDQQNQMQTGNGGMHPSQMQMGVQRMPMDRQNFPQQIQRVPSQGAFTGQPPPFQGNNPQQSYMIRTSQQQQRPTMFINQMPQGGPMSQQPGQLPQQRMNAPQPGSMQQPVRLMQHPNYANSPQQSNQSSGQNHAQINALYARMPPELRQQFDEGDNTKKGMILRDFSKQMQIQSQNQRMQHQYNAGQNQYDQQNQGGNAGIHSNQQIQLANAPPQRMPQMDQRPNFSQQPMQHVSNQGNYPMNVNQSQFGAVPGSQQPYLIRNIQPAHNQQQPVQNVMKHSPMPVVQGSVPMQQQRIGGPPSVNANPRSIPNYANSPQINQPASVSNLTAPTPRPAPTPAPVNIDDPEYKKLLTEMKSYQKEVKTVLERIRIDGHDAIEKSLLRIIEIMDGKREVDIKMLTKLLTNLKRLIRQSNPMRFMADFCNKINTVPQSLDTPILPEGWESLDKFRIKVPSSVLKHIEKIKEQEQQSRKRKPSDDAVTEENVLEIPCVYQKSSRLDLPSQIADELLAHTFSIDNEALPISEHSCYIQILVDFKPKDLDKFKYSIPPLRLSISVKKYPSCPIQLVSFDQDNALQSRIMDALKKNITDDAVMHSITKLIAIWKKTVVQTIIPVTDTESRKLILPDLN